MKHSSVLCSAVSSVALAAAAAGYNDLDSAMDPVDPTNGGYWDAAARLETLATRQPVSASSSATSVDARSRAAAVSADPSAVDGVSFDVGLSCPLDLDFTPQRFCFILR